MAISGAAFRALRGSSFRVSLMDWSKVCKLEYTLLVHSLARVECGLLLAGMQDALSHEWDTSTFSSEARQSLVRESETSGRLTLRLADHAFLEVLSGTLLFPLRLGRPLLWGRCCRGCRAVPAGLR